MPQKNYEDSPIDSGIQGDTSDQDGDGFSTEEGDCDDLDPRVYPGASDTVGDGTDQDCDGADGVDADGDGVPDLASGGDDCDDNDAALGTQSEDSDCDGILTDDDCDDNDDTSTAIADDRDCDGALTADDCDDNDSESSPPGGTFESVSAGNYHTCGVTTSGNLECWGSDSSGQASPPSGP